MLHHPPTGRSRNAPALPRRGRIAVLVLVCVLTGLGVMLMTLMLGSQPVHLHPWVGAKIPSVPLEPLLNASEPLDPAQLEGKVTVINFWGPWCQPCLMEFPSLLALRERFKDNERFEFVSIAADGKFQPENPAYQENQEYLADESQMILARFNSDLPIYTDQTAQLRRKLMSIADFTGYPTTILVGTDGKIAAVWLGYVPSLEREMTKLIREQLGEGSEG